MIETDFLVNRWLWFFISRQIRTLLYWLIYCLRARQYTNGIRNYKTFSVIERSLRNKECPLYLLYLFYQSNIVFPGDLFINERSSPPLWIKSRSSVIHKHINASPFVLLLPLHCSLVTKSPSPSSAALLVFRCDPPTDCCTGCCCFCRSPSFCMITIVLSRSIYKA